MAWSRFNAPFSRSGTLDAGVRVVFHHEDNAPYGLPVCSSVQWPIESFPLLFQLAPPLQRHTDTPNIGVLPTNPASCNPANPSTVRFTLVRIHVPTLPHIHIVVNSILALCKAFACATNRFKRTALSARRSCRIVCYQFPVSCLSALPLSSHVPLVHFVLYTY